MRRRMVCFALLLLLPVLIAASRSSVEVAGEVRAADSKRLAAMVRADVAELGTLLAEDLTYTHSSGKVESREEFLAALSSGKLDYLSLERTEDKVRIYGDTAVVSGRVDGKLRSEDKDVPLALRFTSVWVKGEKGWRMVAWQSTRLP